MNEVMHFQSLDAVLAHFRRLEKLAHGHGIAQVRKAKVQAVARILDREACEAKQRAILKGLRGA